MHKLASVCAQSLYLQHAGGEGNEDELEAECRVHEPQRANGHGSGRALVHRGEVEDKIVVVVIVQPTALKKRSSTSAPY